MHESSGQSPRTSIRRIVTDGLCIGCGLCEAFSDGAITMQATQGGSLRPSPLPTEYSILDQKLTDLCPGHQVTPRYAEASSNTGQHQDLVWGPYHALYQAWATSAEVRFKAATGGVLTALGMFLLDTDQVEQIVHVRAKPSEPLRNEWVVSQSSAEVLANCGSRYGPVAPLAGIDEVLATGRTFAIIAKPCDLNGLDNLAKQDPRVDALCRFRLTMVCGGQSKLTKSTDLLAEFGIEEQDLAEFRYRGYGNPGPTIAVTKQGETAQTTYQEFWREEAGWELETRCKICPDALGESADLAALDIWPGGAPTGEDAGFNGVVVRSNVGKQLHEDALRSEYLAQGEALTVDQLNDFQPHQTRKKYALEPRLQALRDAGQTTIAAPNSRLPTLAQQLDADAAKQQYDATSQRIDMGKFREPTI